MGIKVLLADDSAAIKKVVQLCLQDFGIELKSLGNGKEVMELARNFKPDLALIDVMLPHKPGFEVAAEIKRDPVLKATPVIMLWSNFMEFDDAKFKASGANGKLEKPFEAKDLRELVKKLVPKTQSQPLSSFVEPPSVDFKNSEEGSISRTSINSGPSTFTGSIDGQSVTQFNMQTASGLPKVPTAPKHQEVKQQQAPAPQQPPPQQPPPQAQQPSGDSEWVRKDLGKFKVNIDSDGYEDNTVAFQYDESDLKTTVGIMKAEVGGGHGAPEAQKPVENIEVVIPDIPEPVSLAPTPSPTPTPAPTTTPAPSQQTQPSYTATSFNPAPQPAAAPTLDPQQVKALMEKQIADIVQKEIREVLEKAVWKIVPDIATQIIKEEISRLTSEN